MVGRNCIYTINKSILRQHYYKLADWYLESHALHNDECSVFQINAQWIKMKMILTVNKKVGEI